MARVLMDEARAGFAAQVNRAPGEGYGKPVKATSFEAVVTRSKSTIAAAGNGNAAADGPSESVISNIYRAAYIANSENIALIYTR